MTSASAAPTMSSCTSARTHRDDELALEAQAQAQADRERDGDEHERGGEPGDADVTVLDRRAPPPRRRCDRRGRRRAAARSRRAGASAPRSCVTQTTGVPSSTSWRASRSSTALAFASSADVGSSISITCGSVASARARQARCASPPDSSPASRSRNDASRPTRSSSSTPRSSSQPRSASRRLSSTRAGERDRAAGRPSRPRGAASSGSRSATSSPRWRTVPADGTSRRLQSRSSVDLPEPDGPATTVRPPSGRRASRPSSRRASGGPTLTDSNAKSAGADTAAVSPSRGCSCMRNDLHCE